MSFLNPLLREPTVAYRLINRRNGRILAGHLLTAFDSKSRRRGLLGLDALQPEWALIIAPTNAIHTWFMRFDIDVAFVGKDGRVLKIRHHMKPWRIAAALRGFAVIEMAGGTCVAADTMANDILSVES